MGLGFKPMILFRNASYAALQQHFIALFPSQRTDIRLTTTSLGYDYHGFFSHSGQHRRE